MNICLIGRGIPCLLLANILSNKNIKLSIFTEKPRIKFSTRTLGISKNNIEYLKSQKIDLENSWPINKIKIFNEINKKNEILNFGQDNEKLFYIVKSSELIDLLEKKIKKNPLVKIMKNNKNIYESIIKNKKQFDIVLNFDENNPISKKYFFRRENKDYNSASYTTIINHKKCDNKFAYQVFTKLGPIAFLPVSNDKTSIVFSILNENKSISNEEIFKLINKYNQNYIINSISKIEKFNIKGSILKNYSHKNILCFGDNIHKIHPLAGQGLNMTIRDIKVLSDLIDNKISLGMLLDKSLLNEFENKTKHLNYLYVNCINFIYEFFKFDNKFNNTYSNKIFNFLEKNSLFKKYSTKFADKGFF